MSKSSTVDRDTWRKVARLPWRARAAGLVLLCSAAAPPMAVLVAALGGSLHAAFLTAHSGLVDLIALCAAVATLLVFESPRSASLAAYARQLRARFLDLQSTFDADDRRRPEEGKEKEDDGLPSEP